MNNEDVRAVVGIIVTVASGLLALARSGLLSKIGLSLLKAITNSVEKSVKDEAKSIPQANGNGNGNGYAVATQALSIAQGQLTIVQQVNANTADIQAIRAEQERQKAEGVQYLKPFVEMMKKIDLMYSRQEQLLKHFNIPIEEGEFRGTI